jgi:predicted dehydrogenase
MKIRVGIVGLGKMGLLHASILGVLDDAELVAICEKNSLVRRFGHKIIPGVNLVDDVREFKNIGLDAVYVTTPVASHLPIVKTIYNEGISHNVFVEKPLASSYAQAEQMDNLARNSGGVNMVGYNRRYSVTFKKAKQILDEGTLQAPSFFKGYAYSSDFLGVKTGSKASSRGGVLTDLGCHVVDLVLWFFGQIDVKSVKLESIVGGGSEDSAYFQVRGTGDQAALEGELESSWCMEGYRLPEIGLLIQGANGTLKVDEDKVELKLTDEPSVLWHKHDLNDDVSFFIGGNDYWREDDYFIHSIQNGSEALPDFQTASKIDKIIEQVKDIKGKSGCNEQ